MKNAFKKAFTGAVAVLTIVWSVGLVNLPMTAKAAEAGDVIKGTTLSTLYYYGSDGSRYAFPNEKTYLTWYEDFDDVETLTDSELAAISLAGNIVYRPGSRWIKIESDPKTYAVTPEGTVRWIETEEVAEGLAGSDWNAFIDDVSDTFFVDYTVGTSLMSAADAYNGALVADGSDTYLVWDDAKRAVSSAGMTANRFQTRFVLDGADVDLDGITAGDDLDAEDTELTDTAQLGGEEADAEGGLSISLASDTPASMTIPSRATSIELVKYKLTATEGEVTLDQLIVSLDGVGSAANFEEIYLYEDDTRLVDGRSINSSTRSATFSSLNFDLGSGETRYLSVRGDVINGPTAGDTAIITIDSAADVVTSGEEEVSGSFPVSGNAMTFSATDVGYMTFAKTGSISNPTLGTEEATVAKFTAHADSEDAYLESLTLNIDKSAEQSNFELWEGSEVIATGEYTSDDLVLFTFTDDYLVEEGDTVTLEVTADVGGESGDVLKTAIEEDADVVAYGGDYGFNLDVVRTTYDETGSSCASTSDDCSYVTVSGGSVTFAFNGPSASDLAIDSQDQTFLEFTLTAEDYVEIQQLGVYVNGTGDGLIQTDLDLNLTDIAIRESDGSTWMGPEELSSTGSDTAQYLSFEDTQTLQAGDSIDLVVTADIDSGATSADVYYMALDLDSTFVALTIEDTNGDAVTDIVPSTDITGYNMTLTSSSLTLSVASTPASGTYIIGSQDVDVLGINFAASDSSAVNVTDLVVDIDVDTDGTYSEEDDVDASDHVESCSLYDSDTGSLVDGPENIDSTNEEMTFSNFSWSIGAGETSKLIVRCDFSNIDIDGGTTNDAYVFFVEDSDAVTSEDADGDSITETLPGTTPNYGVNDPDAIDTGFKVITIDDAGTLVVAAASDMPTATIVLGNSTDVSVAKYKFTATNEAFVVNELTLRNDDGTLADDAAVDAITLSYTNSEDETETKTGYLSSGTVNFNGLDLYVGTTAYATLTVMIDTNIVSSVGASSGDTIELDMELSDSGSFEAIGASSGVTLVYSDVGSTDIDANTMTLYKTKPTISLASNSPTGDVYVGNNDVFHFTIAADSRGYVTLNEVYFHLNTTDVGATNWNVGDPSDDSAGVDQTDLALYDTSDLSTELDIDADWTMYESDGSAVEDTDNDDITYIKCDLTTPDTISAGSTVTYALYMTVETTGANAANDDTLRVSLETNTTTDAGVTGTVGTINWEDDSAIADILASLLKTLPAQGYALTF